MEFALECRNDSSQIVQFFLYQKCSQQLSDLVSLVWITKCCEPGVKTCFHWLDDLCFVWGEAKDLKPGSRAETCQVMEIKDLSSTCWLKCNSQYGTFSFQSSNTSNFSNQPIIQTDGSIPPSTLFVGIGMKTDQISDTASLVRQAAPNNKYAFNTDLQYYLGWSAACNLRPGDVLDLTSITSQVIKFTFPSMIATLTDANQIQLSPRLYFAKTQ